MKYVYKLSISQLCTSLKYRSKEYLRENNLHGVPYIMDSTRPKWERIMWFVLSMASTSVTLWIIITIWNKFQEDPTVNEVRKYTQEGIDFPQIFLCHDWSQMNYSHLNKNQRRLYEKLYNWQWGETFEPVEDAYKNKSLFFQQLETMLPNCDTFKQCQFRSEKKLLCSTIFMKALTPVGGCCKFNASEPLSKADTWSLSFVSSVYPFRLYLMDKMDIAPQRDDKPIEVIYEPTTVEIEDLLITTNTPEIRYLTQQQRQCHYGSKALTVNNCELQCQADRIFKMCKCLPWFLADGKRNECRLSQYSCVKLNDAMNCDCLLPCDHTVYTYDRIAASNEIDKDQLDDDNRACRIVIIQWPYFTYRKIIRFGYLEILISFGSIASLFLGFSLVTVIELVYYFTLKVYCGAVMEASRRKCNIVKTLHVESEPRKTDVMYYDYID